MLPLTVFIALASSCAPGVAPETLAAVAQTESRLDPLAIHDNTARHSYQPADTAQAVNIARSLIEGGHSVDMGIMQVNSGNFGWLGLSIEDAFDACASIRAGATILAAYSRYNTGNSVAGFHNGYVQRVLSNSPDQVRDQAKSNGSSPLIAWHELTEDENLNVTPLSNR